MRKCSFPSVGFLSSKNMEKVKKPRSGSQRTISPRGKAPKRVLAQICFSPPGGHHQWWCNCTKSSPDGKSVNHQQYLVSAPNGESMLDAPLKRYCGTTAPNCTKGLPMRQMDFRLHSYQGFTTKSACVTCGGILQMLHFRVYQYNCYTCILVHMLSTLSIASIGLQEYKSKPNFGHTQLYQC